MYQVLLTANSLVPSFSPQARANALLDYKRHAYNPAARWPPPSSSCEGLIRRTFRGRPFLVTLRLVTPVTSSPSSNADTRAHQCTSADTRVWPNTFSLCSRHPGVSNPDGNRVASSKWGASCSRLRQCLKCTFVEIMNHAGWRVLAPRARTLPKSNSLALAALSGSALTQH